MLARRLSLVALALHLVSIYVVAAPTTAQSVLTRHEELRQSTAPYVLERLHVVTPPEGEPQIYKSLCLASGLQTQLFTALANESGAIERMVPDEFDSGTMKWWSNRVLKVGQMREYSIRVDASHGELIDDRTEEASYWLGLALEPWLYFPGETQSILSSLRSPTAQLRPKMEIIREIACDVFDASTPGGNYTLWLDPSRGHVVVQAQVHRRAGHQFMGQPLPGPDDVNVKPAEALVENRTILSCGQIQQVHAGWLPMDCSIEHWERFADGSERVYTQKIRQRVVDLSPNFETFPEAFDLIVPNGTRAFLYGTIDGVRYERNDGIRREFHDGKIIPVVDQALVAQIDESTDDTRARLAAAEPPPTTITVKHVDHIRGTRSCDCYWRLVDQSRA